MLMLLLPPSAAIRASCLVRPRRSEKILSETADQKRPRVKTERRTLRVFWRRVIRDVTLERRRVQRHTYPRWLGVKAPPKRSQQAGVAAAHRAVAYTESAYHSAHARVLETFFSPWAFTGSFWEAGCLWQLYLRQNKMFLPGERKISLKTLMQHFFFRNSVAESLFCCREPVKEMFLVKGIFRSRLATFL